MKWPLFCQSNIECGGKGGLMINISRVNGALARTRLHTCTGRIHAFHRLDTSTRLRRNVVTQNVATKTDRAAQGSSDQSPANSTLGERCERAWMPEAKGQRPDATGQEAKGQRGQRPEAGDQKRPKARGQRQRPEAKGQRSEATGQRPKARGQRPEAKGQRPKARGQRPKAKGQRPKAKG